MCRWVSTIVSIAALVSSASAFAHDADVIYVQVERPKGASQLAERITLTAPSLNLLAPVDANRDGELTAAELAASADAIALGVWDQMPLSAGGVPCERFNHAGRLRQGFVELLGEFNCPAGELKQTFKFLSVLP